MHRSIYCTYIDRCDWYTFCSDSSCVDNRQPFALLGVIDNIGKLNSPSRIRRQAKFILEVRISSCHTIDISSFWVLVEMLLIYVGGGHLIAKY